METMSHNSRKIDDNRQKAGRCLQCGNRFAELQDGKWTDVARVSNLAEAGFLADELVGIGIESLVHQLEEFNAANDRWSAKYLIRVPEQFAREAASHIEQYLFEEEHGQPPVLDFIRSSFGKSANETVSWRPVILVVIAGLASFALGQHFSERMPPRRPPGESLNNAIAGINKRFTTDSVANQPRHRLSLDQRQRQWTLETDRENDGVYDDARHFPAASIR